MTAKKILLLILVFATLLLVLPDEVYAKRTLPRAKPASGTGVRVATTRGVTTSVKFRSDRRAINVTFSNLGIASSISYNLSYNTRGTTQGAGGTIDPSVTSDPTSREIIFGTCSFGVCRYDTGITNAKFVVTTTLKNGRKVVKSFRLKV